MRCVRHKTQFVFISSGYWDVSLPQVRSTDLLCVRVTWVCQAGFPHSDISGSQVTTHLPEAYRSYVTSFIAILCQGIHHTPLHVPTEIGTIRKKPAIQKLILNDTIWPFLWEEKVVGIFYNRRPLIIIFPISRHSPYEYGKTLEQRN